jgi:hypothetical protein
MVRAGDIEQRRAPDALCTLACEKQCDFPWHNAL